MIVRNVHHDVIIVGGGGSALAMAIFLQDIGIKNIGILSKSTIAKSHTSAAKGGINASLGNITEDNPEWHAFDTIKAGDGLCDEDIVKQTCVMAPWIISWLAMIGVQFDSDGGKIMQRKYGGQKTDFGKGEFAFRACFSGDSTGSKIMSALLNKMQDLDGITFYEYTIAVDFTDECLLAYDARMGDFVSFGGGAFVFAGGGFSQMYGTASSSSLLTGDCHAILLNAGAKLKDVELVQFHPTGLFGSGVLISEACRGEGGILLNAYGKRFMSDYSQDLELAPRDIVARAIHEQHYKTGGVFLDVSHLGLEKIRTRLGNAQSIAKFFADVDITQKGVQVFPTAHYNMGGIDVNHTYKIDSHNKAVSNIYVIGEAACASVHGANRLGCNSLLELFTSAKIAAESISGSLSISKNLKGNHYNFTPFIFENQSIMRQKLQNTMDKHCSVIKNEAGLLEALNIVHELNVSEKISIVPKVWDFSFVSSFETENLLLLSKMIISGSLWRKESRGSHLREDYLQKNARVHSIIGSDGIVEEKSVRI